MKEILKSVARTHLALIATSTLLFALALGPDEARRLDQAAENVERLGSVADTLASYQGSSTAYRAADVAVLAKKEDARVRAVAAEFAGRFSVGHDWELYVGPMSYPPRDRHTSTVNDIMLALRSAPKRFVMAPSDATLRSALNAITGHTSQPLSCRSSANRAGDTVTCPVLPPGMRLRRIVVDDFPWQDRAPARLDRYPSGTKLVFHFDHDDDLPGARSLAYEFPVATAGLLGAASDINPDPAEILAQYGLDRGSAVSVFFRRLWCRWKIGMEQSLLHRGLVPHTFATDCFAQLFYGFPESVAATLYRKLPEIGPLTPDQAARQLRASAAAARQKLSVLGQAVDERILFYGGPLVILAIQWVMLAELTALARAIALAVDMRAELPSMDDLAPSWIGIHANAISRDFSRMTVFVLPVVTLLATWLQTDEDFNLAQSLTVLAMLAAAVFAWRALGLISRVRRDLQALSVRTQLRRRAERRAAVRVKLAERSASRTGHLDDDPC